MTVLAVILAIIIYLVLRPSPFSEDAHGNEDHPLVHTAKGVLKGVRERSVGGRSFLSFYAIPYARPPLGRLRFQVVRLFLVFPLLSLFPSLLVPVFCIISFASFSFSLFILRRLFFFISVCLFFCRPVFLSVCLSYKWEQGKVETLAEAFFKPAELDKGRSKRHQVRLTDNASRNAVGN